MTTKKILVTGGAGFIASHIVDELVSKGHDVRIVDNLEPQVHKSIPEYLNKKAELIVGDVRNDETWKKAIEDVDVIYHEAAAVGVGQSMYQISKYMDVNTMGTARMLDLLANSKHNVKKVIVASSMSIYGEGSYECEDCGVVYPELRPEAQMQKSEWEMKCPRCNKFVKSIPTNEEKPLKPTSIYAISKKDQEEMCLSVGRAYGIPTIALRYFNVCGPRQALSNPYTGVCAIFSSRLLNDKPPVIFEDGKQMRDFVSVHDIAQANILALESNGMNYGYFNVGTGVSTNLLQVSEVLSKTYGKIIKPEIVTKFRSGDIRHCYADISKIKKFGYSPKYKSEQAIAEYANWAKGRTAIDLMDKAKKELEEKGLIK